MWSCVRRVPTFVSFTQVLMLMLKNKFVNLLERNHASFFSEMKHTGSQEVYDAIEISRTTVELEFIVHGVVAIAVLDHLVNGSNLSR